MGVLSDKFGRRSILLWGWVFMPWVPHLSNSREFNYLALWTGGAGSGGG
ncbi:MAG: hypothetical protein R2865_15945 [Deinococcales bacterium]